VSGLTPLTVLDRKDSYMTITAKCTIKDGMIKLPESAGLPNGTKVLVSIEPLSRSANRKKVTRELAGTWSQDASILDVFTEVEAERHAYFGREVDL